MPSSPTDALQAPHMVDWESPDLPEFQTEANLLPPQPTCNCKTAHRISFANAPAKPLTRPERQHHVSGG